MPMTPDEVVKILENMLTEIACKQAPKIERLETPIYDVDFKLESLSSAITIIQDYQKLRERVSGIDLPVKELGKIVMFIRHSMFLPENDKLSELNKMIREAIVTYLQQPTEH
jgi:hypothetical protein